MTNVQNKVQAAVENGTPAVEVKSALAGRRFHFIGAGGVGMSGLAQLFIKHKAIVSGSDMAETAVINHLVDAGVDIRIGHDGGELGLDVEAVVVSAAIKDDNPELKLARERGIKVYKYAEMLGRLMDDYDSIAVSGTHGKSTTGSWLVYCLKQLGVDVNFIIGAAIEQLGCSSGTGDSVHFVAEACEYDRSFLNIKPDIGCILNIEQDHLDYYKDEADIIDAFTEFASGIKETGVLIANGEDSNVAKVIMDSRFHENDKDIRCETFGFGVENTYSAQNIKLTDGFYSFDVYHNGQFLGQTQISLPGRHNILNGLAVIAMAYNLHLEPEDILGVLGRFTGIERRMELKGNYAGITVIDDYAHHPTEIKASLAAVRQRYSPDKLWCVFQPHQYSRTRFLLDDFAESFRLADVTIVPQIYFVRDSQESREEINAGVLVERIRAEGSEAIFMDDFEQICGYLQQHVKAGDAVLTMGAGDIWKVADGYIQWLRENS